MLKIMARTRGVFIAWVGLALFLVSVSGDCVLNFTEDGPIIVKSFGSRKITKKSHGPIRFKEGEQIDAYCPAGFQRVYENDGPEDYTSKVKFSCGMNSLIKVIRENDFDYRDRDSYYHPLKPSCRKGPSRVLHESRNALPGCNKNMSYAIGIAPTPSNQIITAGICYDLDRLSLRYVSYVAQPRNSEIISNQLNLAHLQKISLDKELSNVDTFFSFVSQATFDNFQISNKLNHPLLNPFDFDYTSLIRDAGLNVELKGFEYIFNTIWWRNLRLGNWQFYMDALEERTKSVQYVVYMGTSGVLSIPKTSCSSREVITVEENGNTVKAPAYIWAHLKALSSPANASEEFVIIANNSPFNPISNATTFCEDICDQIDWLRTSLFGKVRLLPTMGVVFCCRPEEVADKLDNFPYQEKQSTTMKAISTAELVETQTVAAIIGNQFLYHDVIV